LTLKTESSGPRVVPGPAAKPPPSLRSELEALIMASSSQASLSQPRRRPAPRFNLVMTGLVSTVVGLALAMGTPLEHRCAATFHVDTSFTERHGDELRTALADYLSRFGGNDSGIGPVASRWWIDAPAIGIMQFGLTTTDRRKGVEEAQAAAQGFIAALQARRDEVRRTPSAVERAISELVVQHQDRVALARDSLDSATASLPPADPRVDRDALVQRWRELRTDFTATQEQLAQAAEGFDRLRSDSEPTHGIVSADDRRRALESDPALQQDLRELEVKLSELKLHLLNVWQQSAGRLELLQTAMDELSRTAAESDTTRLPSNLLSAVQSLASETDAFRQTLATFADAWTSEFTSLQRMNVDPAAGEIMDGYQRVRWLLSDFLFAASQRLSALRSHLSVLGEQTSDNARHHVLQSNLTRAFQSAQAAHHRFEFAAGAIDTPDNFRLDAALRSARGLRRRTLEQIQQIEQRLQTEAIEQAKRQRAQALVEAQQSVERIRATAEQTIEQLFSVDDGLIQSVGLTDDFLHAVLKAELAADRLQTTQEYLSHAAQRLRELSAEREATSADIGVKLVSCGVIETELNLPQRARLGGIAFGVTLVTILFGQWLMTRRP